jgi:CRP-like cAMP-binding protein
MALPNRITASHPDASSLAGSPLLASIDKDDLQALVRGARPRSWRAGQTLFQRGDAGDGIYAIVSGNVKIIIEGLNGAEVIVRQLTAGDVFGELSVLDGAPRTATAVATSDTKALHITVRAFDDWIDEHPRVARPMLAQLAHRLRTTNDQVAEIGLLDVGMRIARRMWQRFSDDGRTEPQPGARLAVNQGALAAELGITRESVNKHFARWKSANIIAIDKGVVTLLDAEALEAATSAI